MKLAATTTAWGDADPLDAVLERIALQDRDVRIVELSIGARPVADPAHLLRKWSPWFTFIAHHTAPVGRGRSLMPTLSADPIEAAQLLASLGIKRYTGHPPHRRFCTADEMWSWAYTWWCALGEHGIEWAVETMYEPRTREEVSMSGGYHLATPTEVWSFCERARSVGWSNPLLVDGSHLFIGVSGGAWTEADAIEVLAQAPAAELHISTNDGRRDLHAPLTPADVVWGWVEPHLHRFELVVDEGRRRGNYDISHVARAA